MNHGRHAPVRTLWLGPRSLAILSCALALLAAQPLVASPAQAKSATVRVSGTAEASRENLPKLVRAEAAKPRQSLTRIDTSNFSTRELHILATLEMLQRFFAFDLRPIDHAPVPALIYYSDTLAFIQNISLPMQINCTTSAPTHKPREQAFALTRCLLAPPTLG